MLRLATCQLTVEDSELSGNKTEPLPYGVGAPSFGGGICNVDGTLIVRQ